MPWTVSNKSAVLMIVAPARAIRLDVAALVAFVAAARQSPWLRPQAPVPHRVLQVAPSYEPCFHLTLISPLISPLTPHPIPSHPLPSIIRYISYVVFIFNYNEVRVQVVMSFSSLGLVSTRTPFSRRHLCTDLTSKNNNGSSFLHTLLYLFH